MKRKLNKVIIFSVILLSFLSILMSSSLAQENLWRPEGPVELILSSNPGGGHDVVARVLVQKVLEITGVRMNLVHMPEGGGVVALNTVMDAKPDGYLVGQFGSGVVTNQYALDGIRYNPSTYRHIGIHSGDDNHLVVSTSGKFADMDVNEFLEYAKENPVKIAISGSWQAHDNTRYLIETAAGVKFQRVGIKGGAQCALAVVAGDVDAAVPYPGEIKPHVDAGNLKPLAHTGLTRNDFFPDVPSFTEMGYDVSLPSFKTWSLPKDTPDDIYNGWVDIFEKTLSDPGTAKALLEAGVQKKVIIGHEDTYDYLMSFDNLMKEIEASGVYEQEL